MSRPRPKNGPGWSDPGEFSEEAENALRRDAEVDRFHALLEECLSLGISRTRGGPIEKLRGQHAITLMELAIAQKRDLMIAGLRRRGYAHTCFDEWSNLEIRDALASARAQ